VHTTQECVSDVLLPCSPDMQWSCSTRYLPPAIRELGTWTPRCFGAECSTRLWCRHRAFFASSSKACDRQAQREWRWGFPAQRSWLLAAPRPVFKGTHVQSPISAATVSTDGFLGLLVFSCSAVAVAIFFALSVPEIGHK